MKILFYLFLFVACIFSEVFSQQPKYTRKKFVNYQDSAEFKVVNPPSDGMMTTYILTDIQIWDVDDNNTTHIMGSDFCLVQISGQKVKNKRNGLFTSYLIDSADHSKRYKLYEQNYKDDRINGEWKEYNLKGTLVKIDSIKNDSLVGTSRTFWIDGKTVIQERQYFGGQSWYIEREYSKGKLVYEISIRNKKKNGLAKEYYDDGSLKREAVFVDDIINGNFKYYYPGGKLWIEQEFRNGKSWTVFGNYDKNGKAREKGTLKNGNGTLYLYNDDGTVREIETYVNGVLKE